MEINEITKNEIQSHTEINGKGHARMKRSTWIREQIKVRDIIKMIMMTMMIWINEWR